MKRYFARTFASLANRNFRLYFFGLAASTIGTWTQKVAQAWLVLELTDSGTLLGLTAALQSLPTLLLGPWGGLIADRFDKRRILLVTQSAAILPALLLGVTTATGTVTLPIVLIAATLTGAIDAFDKPARQTIVVEMVGREHITNAVTLNNITINAGRIVGPAIAGLLITGVGIAFAFFVNAASFFAILIALFFVRTDQLQKPEPTPRARGQLVEGFRYVRRTPGIAGPLILLTVTGLVAWEWTVTLPLLAKDTYHGDAQLVGWLFTAMGAGAIIGVLAIAGALTATTPRLILSSLLFAGVLFGIALAPTLWLTLALVFLLGTTAVSYRAITASLAQLRADPRMRGRTMSLFVIASGGTSPVSGPLLGWLCETLGVRATMAIGGGVSAVTALAVLAYMRRGERRSVATSGAAPQLPIDVDRDDPIGGPMVNPPRPAEG